MNRAETTSARGHFQKPGGWLIIQSASECLASWCGTERLLLKKLHSDEVEALEFELTTAAERAMQWLEDLHSLTVYVSAIGGSWFSSERNSGFA
jgi:hypothetical protein